MLPNVVQMAGANIQPGRRRFDAVIKEQLGRISRPVSAVGDVIVAIVIIPFATQYYVETAITGGPTGAVNPEIQLVARAALGVAQIDLRFGVGAQQKALGGLARRIRQPVDDLHSRAFRR